MNYTQNYHLPQWEKTDRIVMEDFNQMCAGIDSGIREAKTAADTAQAAAEEAAKLPYAIGTYVGNSAEQHEFRLGFRPSGVLVWGNQSTSSSWPLYLFTNGVNFTGKLRILDDGFTVEKVIMDRDYPVINSTQVTYTYIAFR